jgi:mRNA-degrading endonuclease YafQ of YafQ-DinJ toxin-antitoxin module
MEIIYLKGFRKSYDKLSKIDQGAVDEVLCIFQENPLSPQLKNHVLK